MILYCYDASGVYTGPISPRLSPARPLIDGQPNYLRPANATDVVPPTLAEGQAAVFDGQTWRVVEDHRGAVVYDTATRQAATVRSLGPLPEGYTATPPPSARHTWDGASWQPDMAAIRADAEAVIDAQADAQLAPYISLTPGRAMTYQAKEAQASAYLAATDPDPAAYPLIAGEVGITADTPRAVAETILAMSRSWHAMGAAIEAVRLAAKKRVREAQTPEAVQAVCDALAWPVLE